MRLESEVNEMSRQLESEINEMSCQLESESNEMSCRLESEINEISLQLDSEINEVACQLESEINNEMSCHSDSEINEMACQSVVWWLNWCVLPHKHVVGSKTARKMLCFTIETAVVGREGRICQTAGAGYVRATFPVYSH